MTNDGKNRLQFHLCAEERRISQREDVAWALKSKHVLVSQVNTHILKPPRDKHAPAFHSNAG